ncbi:hypothetical protein TNCT_692251 [Trichonephila clavata]|uniref:Uncharacterized protein n=1 Tax=Trichonephila clavata TaxID=2740835 RepID=A0A8X6GEY4_TRICU|nr:hypothetical protein TNCT_692251 [Trichonephila clavata]
MSAHVGQKNVVILHNGVQKQRVKTIMIDHRNNSAGRDPLRDVLLRDEMRAWGIECNRLEYNRSPFEVHLLDTRRTTIESTSLIAVPYNESKPPSCNYSNPFLLLP